MHTLIPLLELAGLHVILVDGLRTAAMILDGGAAMTLDGEGVVLVRASLEPYQVTQVADQVLAAVTESSLSV